MALNLIEKGYLQGKVEDTERNLKIQVEYPFGGERKIVMRSKKDDSVFAEFAIEGGRGEYYLIIPRGTDAKLEDLAARSLKLMDFPIVRIDERDTGHAAAVLASRGSGGVAK